MTVSQIILSSIGKVPSKKNRMRVYGNRMVKDKGVKDFEHKLKQDAQRLMDSIQSPPLTGPVEMELEIITGDKRRRDLQNYFGSICDALNEVVYEDDSQIQTITAQKLYKKGIWSYTITITPINGDDNGSEKKRDQR